MEIGITDNLADLVSSGDILTLAEGNYSLVEVQYSSLPLGMNEMISGLRAIGKTPILAHPERSKEFQELPERILDFIDLGSWVQINASSLYGDFGDKANK